MQPGNTGPASGITTSGIEYHTVSDESPYYGSLARMHQFRPLFFSIQFITLSRRNPAPKWFPEWDRPLHDVDPVESES